MKCALGKQLDLFLLEEPPPRETAFQEDLRKDFDLAFDLQSKELKRLWDQLVSLEHW